MRRAATSRKTGKGKDSKNSIANDVREILKNTLDKSMKIAEIKQYHKKSQNIFENNLIKKEVNYIIKDPNFCGSIYPGNNDNLKWVFISKLLGKIITIENIGEIHLYEFNTKRYNKYILFKEEEENKIIISSELFEHAQTAESKLLILLNDLTFITVDLIILNSQPKPNEEYDIKKIINSATSKPFDFKPYLNLQNIHKLNEENEDIEEEIEEFNNTKNIIIFPKTVNDNCKEIILNFSKIAGKFLVFNFYSFSIIGNYIINHRDLEEKNDNNNLDNIYNFINLFVNKSWTMKQYEFASSIIERICKTKSEQDFKKLGKVLSMNDPNDDEILEKIKTDEMKFDDEQINEYDSIIVPVINFQLGDITIYTILKRLKTFFDKVYDCFNAFKENNFSLIKGNSKVFLSLFMKCFARNINLKDLFKFQDKKNTGYVDEQIAHELLNDLPIGFNDDELKDIFTLLDLFNESKKYMYNYLFDIDEYLIAKIIFFSPLNQKQNNSFCLKCENPFESELETLKENEVSNYLINSIFNKRELTDILYLKTSNVIFVITPFNKNIYIFKRNTKLTNLPEYLDKIGTINLNSFHIKSPLFMYFIEERNLLITQKLDINSTELVFINIYEDLIFPFKEKKFINYILYENSKNVSKKLIYFGEDEPIVLENFFYLKRNEIFLLYSNKYIYLVNPKIPTYNLSLKMDGKKRNVYTDTCKRICENPDERMGESLLKILWKKPLYVPLKKLMTFSFVNNIFGSEHSNNYSSTDWLILLNVNNEIESYSVNQLYISIRRKDIDIPLPSNDEEQLQDYINNKRENSFNNYQQNELKNFNLYYNMLKKKDSEIINQIAFNIKESLIKGNMLIISPKYFQIQNINQLVYLLKYLHLNYSPFQLFEIYPELNFVPLNYDPNAEFLKNEFSLSKKNYDEIVGNEYIRIPRTKNLFKSDLSELDYKYTVFDSGLKKLAMFMYKKNKKEKAIFELIDEKKEEILNSHQFTQGCQKIGLLSPNYLNNDELKELLKAMNTNSNNAVTLDAFLNFLKKYDIQSILLNIKIEKSFKEKNGYVDYSEAEKFMLSPFADKIKRFKKKLMK